LSCQLTGRRRHCCFSLVVNMAALLSNVQTRACLHRTSLWQRSWPNSSVSCPCYCRRIERVDDSTTRRWEYMLEKSTLDWARLLLKPQSKSKPSRTNAKRSSFLPCLCTKSNYGEDQQPRAFVICSSSVLYCVSCHCQCFDCVTLIDFN
jgi:hypothetical protein